MNTRALVLAAPALVACFSFTLARADDDKVPADYKCDLRKFMAADENRTLPVGTAVSQIADDEDAKIMRELDEAGTELSSDEERTKTHYERIELVAARDEAANTSERQYHYTAWKLEKKGADADKSLEGKVVVVRRSGERTSFSITDHDGKRAKVSDAALAFVRKEHGPKSLTDDDKKKLEQMIPEKPVAPDAEFTGDAKALADAMFESAPIDEDKSSVKGKLGHVRKESGVLLGVLVLEIKVQLEYVPKTKIEWTEGGRIELTAEHEAPLEDLASPREDDRMTMRMKGTFKIDTAAGPRLRELDMSGTKTDKTRLLDKAPAAVKLQFDPEADYRWDFQEWAKNVEPDAPPHVGDRSFFEIDSTTTSKVKVGGKTTVDKTQSVAGRFEVEVSSVVEKKETELKALATRWKLVDGDEDDDCLEGKTVVWKPGKSGFKVLDAAGKKVKVSDAAKKFIEGSLVPVLRSRAVQLDNLQLFLGDAPIEPGKELAIDPAGAAKKIFSPDTEVVPETSTATGKVTDVKLVAGDHQGKLDVTVKLKLLTIPGAKGQRFPEDAPGTCDLHYAFEGSLDLAHAEGTATVELDYYGKGSINGQAFQPKVVTKKTIHTGPLPRRDAEKK